MGLHNIAPTHGRLTGIAAALFRALLPYAEREEVLDDLAREHHLRAAQSGRFAARVWLWRQLLGSLPALLRRTLWRGWTGFEPRASELQPGGFMAESWIMDLRYSARRLTMRPAYTVLAVLTLALGAGGTAAIFSVVRALLLDPLPIAREAEVGVLWMPGDWSEAEFLSLRPNFPGFRAMTAVRPMDQTLDVPGQPLRLVPGVGTSAEFFDVMGRGAMIGRTFQSGDDALGANPVAVLSYSLWRELGASPSLVGQQLMLGGVARTVVGVMPPDFWYPTPKTQMWTPMLLSPRNGAGNYALVGRIQPGVRIDHMEAQLRLIANNLGKRFKYPPAWDKTRAPAITPIRQHIVGNVRPSLIATFAAMALILLTACVNVTALMLGQMGRRSTELAVRSALGAGRQRLMQQIVTEALLVGALAGVVGAAFAAASFKIVVHALPLGALANTAQLDWTLFWATAIIAVAGAAAVAIIPCIVLWRGNLRNSMSASRSAGLSVRGGRLEGALVVVQVGLAVLLTTGAALLIRTVSNLRAVNPGLHLENTAVVDVTMPSQLSNDQLRRAVLDATATLQRLPEVRAAAATWKLPLRGPGQDWGIDIPSKPDLPETTTYFRVVTHDYFRTLGIAVKRGRGFLPSDGPGTARVVVINEALAAKYFPGEDPIGKIVSTGFDKNGETIVGVVENVAEARLTDAAVAARYMLYDQVPAMWHEASFVVQAPNKQSLPSLLQAARTTLEREGHQLAIQGTFTMESVFDEAMGAPRNMASLLSLLAGLAVLLGAIGVYGMISHFVARRMWEYGIRIALGLAPGRLVAQVMRRGIGLVLAGSVVGIASAYVATRLLASLLFGVKAMDAFAISGAVLVLLAVGSIAAFVPARRASRTDPAIVLREQ